MLNFFKRKPSPELSHAGATQRQLNKVTGVLGDWINTLYARDADGHAPNYDSATYRIRCPLPWGVGAKGYGLSTYEARALRTVMRRMGGQVGTLIECGANGNQWYLNIFDYPDADAALTWLQRHGPTLAEWRTALDGQRAGALDRMNKRRGKG